MYGESRGRFLTLLYKLFYSGTQTNEVVLDFNSRLLNLVVQIIQPMKSKILLMLISIIALSTTSFSVNAQTLSDLIVLRTDKYIECTVTNVSEDFIHYKNGEVLEQISVELVKKILFGDGTEKVIFEEKTTPQEERVSKNSNHSTGNSSAAIIATQTTINPPMKKNGEKSTKRQTPQYISVRPYNPAFCGIMSATIPGGGMFVLDENQKAWTYFGTTLALATLTGLFSGLAIEAYDYDTAIAMSVLSGISATALITVDIVSIVDAVKTAKRKNCMYQDVWEKKK